MSVVEMIRCGREREGGKEREREREGEGGRGQQIKDPLSKDCCITHCS